MEQDLNSAKKARIPRKITKQRLKNIGLYYLKRFESSTANLRQVLMRRVKDYAYHDADFDRHEATVWIEEILSDFERFGYLDDQRYSEIKIKNYVTAGKSPRYIQGKLREKGIDENTIATLLEQQDYDPYDACLKLARKKHLGPYSPDEQTRQERRSKDMAILVRAGFDYDVVVRVLETEESPSGWWLIQNFQDESVLTY